MKRLLNWKTATVLKRQNEIKHELDAVIETGGVRGRANAILERIHQINDSVASNDVLDLYILAMSGLRMEIQSSVYPQRTTQQLARQVEAVLKLLGPELRKSKLSFLRADYQRIQSQIDYRSGNIISSRWNLAIAEMFTGTNDVDKLRRQFDAHGEGLRLARQGHLIAAGEVLSILVENDTTPINLKTKIAIDLLPIYRMLKLNDKFDHLVSNFLNNIYKDDDRVVWELAIRESESTNELHKLIKLYRNRKMKPEYLLDMVLRIYSSCPKRYFSKIPILRNKRVDGDFDHRLSGIFFDAAECIQHLHDPDFSVESRIFRYGEILANVKRLPTFEYQLLFLQAGARWCRTQRLKKFEATLNHELSALRAVSD